MTELHALRERAKELRCLYRVQDIVSQRAASPDETFERVLAVIPDGWQQPAAVGARIVYLGRSYVGPGYAPVGHCICEPILVGGFEAGRIEVTDCSPGAAEDGETFLAEEVELLRSIAVRLSEYLEWKHTELLSDRVAADAQAHWRWRQRYAEALARNIDAVKYSVSAVYLGGSTQSGAAGPGSDIDLLVVTDAAENVRNDLGVWLDGWSRCLGELARQQTGQEFPRGILNVQWASEQPNVALRADLQALPLRTRV